MNIVKVKVLHSFSHIPLVNTPIQNEFYRSLCLKYADTVYGLIVRSVKDPKLAEDLFLKVFLEIKNHMSSQQDEGVLIKIIAIIKRVITQSGNQLLCTSKLKLDSASTCTVEMIESQAKTIFDLVYLDGYSLDEVSKKSELSITEVKKCIHQSVEKLRKPASINLPK